MARRHEAVRHFRLDVRKAKSAIIRADVSVMFIPGKSRPAFTIIHLLKPLEAEREAEEPRHLAAGGKKPRDLSTSATRPSVSLTRREIEVLRLLAEGAGTGEIAKLLYIGVDTVRSRLSAVFLTKRNRLI
jgi:two-component system response regulator DesR